MTCVTPSPPQAVMSASGALANLILCSAAAGSWNSASLRVHSLLCARVDARVWRGVWPKACAGNAARIDVPHADVCVEHISGTATLVKGRGSLQGICTRGHAVGSSPYCTLRACACIFCVRGVLTMHSLTGRASSTNPARTTLQWVTHSPALEVLHEALPSHPP